MEKNVAFQLQDVVEIPEWCEDYPEHKFTVYKGCFLSTAPNSHEIPIPEDILRRDAKTILGNFLVAKIEWGDVSSHRDDEVIFGYAPKEQEIEFIQEGDIVKAYCYFVVSKRYSREFNGIFEFDNLRNSSVEMTVQSDDEDNTLGIDIWGLTALGKRVNGSCPDADIKMVRFSEQTAEAYFKKSNLKQFVEEKEQSMAETYKIDKSKEAISDTPWGDVDKTDLRNKIMEAANRAELVKEVYMLVEDGWEEAPSEHLKYPVMQLKGDTFVYNRDGLAAALGYAKKENESTVINKVEAIYKKLDLDESDGKEEEAKMDDANIQMEEVVEEQTEMQEAEQTEETTMAETETAPDDSQGEVKEMEETEPCDEQEEEAPAELSCDELMAKIAELEAAIEEKENIIMEKDTELGELREFKAGVQEKEKAVMVEGIMAEIKDFIDEVQFADIRNEGLACTLDGVDAWANKTKAVAFDASKKKQTKKTDNGVWSFAAPQENKHEAQSGDIWTRLRNKKNN